MSLEGANCADLPPFVIDKYFDCNVAHEPLRAMVARAVCGRCVVQDECLSEALTMPHLPKRGIVGGVNVAEVRTARRWRWYEQGQTDAAPAKARPEWLPMTEATHDQEQLRLASDVDDEGKSDPLGEKPAIPAPRAVVTHPNENAPRATAKRAPKPTKERRPRPPSVHRFTVDVPVPLKDANCADMPHELVQKYFNADVLRQAAAAQVAMAVCSHCVILDSCLQRALNGSNVRESGVIAGMGARELKRGRLWRRYEQGVARKVPTTDRPSWLEPTAAGQRFDANEATTDRDGSQP